MLMEVLGVFNPVIRGRKSMIWYPHMIEAIDLNMDFCPSIDVSFIMKVSVSNKTYTVTIK